MLAPRAPPSFNPQRHLRSKGARNPSSALRGNSHAVSRKIEFEPRSIGDQHDHDAMLVSHIDGRGAIDNRGARRGRRVGTLKISQCLKVIDVSVCVEARRADIYHGDPFDGELL